MESQEGTQTDIPQEDKVSETIETRNTPPTNDIKKTTYIVKSFINLSGKTFRYIKYESRKALFDYKASVEEGDEIILMRDPIDNNNNYKERYPLFIPKNSYKKVNE